MRNIWINDGGHGGVDTGATYKGVYEKDWNLEASNYITKRMKDLGFLVKQTRSTDVYLDPTTRTNIINRSGARYCLSHHFNAGGGVGVETIHSIKASPKIARKIALAIKDEGQHFRRVFTRTGSTGKDYYYMHRNTAPQTTIIEYGFMDSNTDFNKMQHKEYRVKMYEAVIRVACEIEGIDYIGEANKTNDEKLYRVQVGAFRDKNNAANLQKSLKKLGIDSIIV